MLLNHLMDSYLFALSLPKTGLQHTGCRWRRWLLRQSCKLVSEERQGHIKTHVTAALNTIINPTQKTPVTHRLIQRRSGHVDIWGVVAIKLIGTIGGAAYNLTLDGGAQHCAQHLHHHSCEQHGNGSSAHEWGHTCKNHFNCAGRGWRTVSCGRIPLFLVAADEHGEGWIWHVETLQK